jgi:hypothetical protein
MPDYADTYFINIIFTRLSTSHQEKSLDYVLTYPLDITMESCKKMPEFFEKSPSSGAGKHPDFQVTSCLHFVITNVDFAQIESEKMSIFCENANIC